LEVAKTNINALPTRFQYFRYPQQVENWSKNA